MAITIMVEGEATPAAAAAVFQRLKTLLEALAEDVAPDVVMRWQVHADGPGRSAPQDAQEQAARLALGARLRARRHELGYTMAEFGMLVGVPSERIGQLERGAWPWRPPHTLQVRLAALLRCTVDELSIPPRVRPLPLPSAPLVGTTGARLGQRRRQLGLTQAALALRARVPVTAVCRWERDRVRPYAKTLVRLARALECPVSLLRG